MKSEILIFGVIFSIISFANAFAQEPNLTGEVSITGVAVNLQGQKAKFNEYRDIRDGVYVGADVKGETEKYYVDLNAQDVGYKTQKYELSGGKWGSFKYYFDYTEIPHNITDGAKTFYTGVGGNNLTSPTIPPSKNINTWNTFDYSTDRTNYGGGFKLEMFKPFYFDASFSQEKKVGVYPMGAAGTSPGGISIELPAPINYSTDSLRFEGGYLKNPLSLSVGYSSSTFRDQNSSLNFFNPAAASTATTPDSLTLPPDNNYYKLDLKGGLKLPFNSKFAANLSTSSTQSGVDLSNSYINNSGGRTGILLSNYVFNGKIDTQNCDFLLTSSPVSFLDAKLLYKYYNTNNKSNSINTTDVSQTPPIFSNPLFDYRKERYGAELGFKLPASFYLATSYTHEEVQRSYREDVPENSDDIYGGELRWKGLDFMVAKVGYERLQRRGDFVGTPSTSATDTNNIEQFQRRFDVASRNQDTYKGSLEFFPIENLNLTLGYKYKDTDYMDTILGLRDDRRSNFNFNADYLIAKRVRLFGYLDYEYIKLDQFERQLPASTTAFNPSTPPTSTAFNWTVTQTETDWAWGVGTEIYILLKKLTLKVQYDNWKSDGFADYTYLLGSNPLPAGQTQNNIDISNWGNYETRSYMAKLTYNLNKTFSFSAGYTYQKFIVDDAQYNGYVYFYPTTATTPSFLTGAYNNPSYEASIVFLSSTYRF